MEWKIYTDGACAGNPGPGGYGTILFDETDQQFELSRGFRWTTNNRMEILSVVAGLETLPVGQSVTLFSDSRYVLDALSKNWISGWKRKSWMTAAKTPVKNQDLWQRLDDVVEKHNMAYEWVRGHASNVFNNRCDELAVAARLRPDLLIDEAYEEISPFRSVATSLI